MRQRHKHDRQPQRRTSRRDEWIYGRQPVAELLKAQRREIFEVCLPVAQRREPEQLTGIRLLAQALQIPLRTVDRLELDTLCDGGNHQGVALRVGHYPYIDFDQVLDAVSHNSTALVLLLDHLEDPQNLGSLLRSAEATGVTAVILPADRSAAVTPAAVRASAGAAEHLKIARVVNLVRAMQQLQSAGLWLTGLAAHPAARLYTELDLKGPVGLVVGSEGRGLTRLVAERCDFMAALPMTGAINSLNAGVAGAIALYEVLRQRHLP